MINRFSFYFRQASNNLKRSILVILSISIIISMIAGVLFYIDSYEYTSKNNAFTNVFDINIQTSASQIDFSKDLLHDYGNIMESINKSGLSVQNTFRYAFFDSGYSHIYRKFTNNSEMNDLGLKENENMSLNVFIADSIFYNSSAFSNYFTLYQGKLPTNNSEILLDVNAAQHLNYHVGEKVNLTMAYNTGFYRYGYCNISNIIISGVYYSHILNNYSILDTNYINPYNNSNFETHDFQVY